MDARLGWARPILSGMRSPLARRMGVQPTGTKLRDSCRTRGESWGVAAAAATASVTATSRRDASSILGTVSP